MVDPTPRAVEIVDPQRRIVDSHHHIFDRTGRRYLPDEFRQDLAAGHRVVASVFVEAGAFVRCDGPEWMRPLGEVEFANGVAAMGEGGWFGVARPCAAIVAHADLRGGDDVDRLLDRMQATAGDRLRGIRQLAMDAESEAPFSHMARRPPRGLLRDERFHNGIARLGRRKLSFDLAIYHEQFNDADALIAGHPDVTFVLNHLGMVYGQGASAGELHRLRDEWAGGLATLARHSNLVCKIGGLGMPLWGILPAPNAPVEDALVDAWAPYVDVALESFGADRCMAESNFPIDSAACDYATLWNVLKRIVSGRSEEERDALFSSTASRVYGISLPA